MPAGDRQPQELLLNYAAWLREPVRVAEELGHSVERDSFANGRERWTCKVCRQAVIREGTNIYGGAATGPCTKLPPTLVPDRVELTEKDRAALRVAFFTNGHTDLSLDTDGYLRWTCLCDMAVLIGFGHYEGRALTQPCPNRRF